MVRRFRIAESGSAGRGEKREHSTKRRAVLDLLEKHADGLDQDVLAEQAGVSKAILRKMVQAGLLHLEERRVPAPAPDCDRTGAEPDFELNDAQRTAIDRIEQLTRLGEFRSLLLYGVSGSGKTEVYVRAIRSVLADGKQAILLIPEIALTTQMVDRLASRFHDVAVVHSGLTDVQRSLTWSAIARGEKRVVIGTRSAVFAPCPDLGLIVVDEEQEPSFKNQRSPRFHTRDVAIKRAQLASIPVVLGSATPSLETWHNCERLTHFERITLPARIAGLPMPTVEFVDMRVEKQKRTGVHLLSRRMEECIQETLSAGHQSVLLLNRRGYATYLMCPRCRNPVVCPNCRANMVFHKTTGNALCHYCQAKMIVPRRCGNPSCKGTLIRWGMGTQRVDEELHEKFPQARIRRMDSDTMTHADAYRELMQAFLDREFDVLVGTQMIAKGLDFPLVAFVGVVNADTSLAAPDFRASERTFQLVTQTAGRSGRADTGGHVVVQSISARPPVLDFAAKHAYAPFAEHELAIRKQFGWPPFSRLARIVVSHPAESRARTTARSLADEVRSHLADHALDADVLGPQTAPMSRLRNQYRYDFLIRAPHAGKLMETLEHLRHTGALKLDSRMVVIDVDPVSLL